MSCDDCSFPYSLCQCGTAPEERALGRVEVVSAPTAICTHEVFTEGHCSRCGVSPLVAFAAEVRRSGAAEAELRETASALEVCQSILADERKRFIREAAMHYLAALPYSASDETARAVYDDCWRDARGLWDAKPEDC